MGPLSRFSSLIAFLCLLLSGCNIKVSVLGEGHISVVTPNVPACSAAAPDICLNAGYNQAVELAATPADGYQFEGWAGDCGGTENCIVHSLGNKHTVAVFKRNAASGITLVPSMRYINDFFFSGPWPSDIRRKKDGTLALADYPVGNGLLASSAKSEAAKQTGFARNGNIYIPLQNHIQHTQNTQTETAYYPAQADSYLQLVNLSPHSARYLQRIPLKAHLFTSDNIQTNELLQAEPDTGYVLEPDTTYGIVMFQGNAVNTNAGWPIGKSTIMKTIIDRGADGLLGQHWEQIKPWVIEHTGFTPNDVAAFSIFTTQPIDPDYAAVREFLASSSFDFSSSIYPLEKYSLFDCDSANPFSPEVKLRNYLMYLPYILTGKPPHLLTGGRLNKNSTGKIIDTDTPVTTKVSIALPCIAPAEGERYPIEIHALPTGFDIETYWSEYLMLPEKRQPEGNVIRVFIAAPHTFEREYGSGYQSLSLIKKLTGIESQELAVFLGDFNPFNISAIHPQYMQYAMEILSVKALLKPMYDMGVEEQRLIDERGFDSIYAHYADFSNAHPDFNDITLIGTSLGGLSVLHANIIDPSSNNLVLSYMPRPNASHINNVWDYLDAWISESNKATLAKTLGVTFPVATGDPLLGILQTAIDSIDSNNLIQHTQHQNTLLVLPEFENSLHGGHAAYSVASAIDHQSGLTGLWFPTPSNYTFPFDAYLQTPPESTDVLVQGNPIKVLIPQWREANSVLTFSSQMRAGNGFIWSE